MADTTPPAAQLASTNGWDTVYAIRFPDVNEGIIAQGSSPPSVSQTSEDPDMGTIALQGTFGAWQLTTGGDGKNLSLSVPITSSSLTFSGKTHTYPTLVSAVISVNLLWLSADGTDDKDDTSSHQSSLKPASGKAHAVTVGPIDSGGNTMSETQQSFYRTLLEDWLNANPGAFAHVFTWLDVNAEAAKEEFQWLKPTAKLYAVVDVDGDAAKSLFGVLCMTGKRPSPGIHAISPFSIPAGVNSGFLIAPERVMSELFLPHLPLLFANATAADFTITDGQLQITNANKLQFLHQQLDDGSLIQPEIDAGNFTLTIDATYMTMQFTDLHFPWSPGISVHVTHSATSTLKMTSDGKLKMDVTSSNTTGNIQTETWVTITEIVSSIVLSIAGSVGGGFLGSALKGGTTVVTAATDATIEAIEVTAVEAAENVTTNVASEASEEAATEATALISKTASVPGKFASFFARNWAKLLGGAIGAGAGGALGSIPSIIGAVANDHENVPTLNQLGTEALQPLTWPNLATDGLTLVSGALNGSFQMGINLAEKPVKAQPH